jgi:hypothetical protein
LRTHPPSTEAWTGGHTHRGQALATSRGSGSTPYSTTFALQHINGSAVFTITDVKKRAAQAKKSMDSLRPLSSTTQLSAAASTPLSSSSFTQLPGMINGIRVNSNGSASNATTYSRSTGNLTAATGDTIHFVLPAPRPDLLTAPPPHQSSQPQATVALHLLQLVPVADPTLRHTAAI